MQPQNAAMPLDAMNRLLEKLEDESEDDGK